MRMRTKSLKSNHFFSIVSMGIQLGSSFIVFLFLLQILSPEDLGQWIIYTTLYSLAELAKSGLIQNGYIHFSSVTNIDKKELYASGLTLSIIAALVIGVLVTLISIPLSYVFQTPELIKLAIYYPLFSIAISLQRFFEIHLISENNFKKLSISKATFGILFILSITIVELNSNITLTIIPILQIIAASITVLLSTMFLSYKLHIQKCTYKMIKKLILYGRFAMGTNLGSMFLNKIDVFILSVFLGPVSVAVYNTASRLINIIEIPLTSISQVSFPRISQSFQKESSRKTANIFELDLALTGIAIIPISLTLFLFADDVIRIIASESYAESSTIIKILCVAVIFKAVGRFSGISLDAVGLPQWNFYVLVISILFNLILNLIFIKLFATTGVAIATLICITVTSLSLLFLVKKVIPIEIRKIILNIKPLFYQIIKTISHEFAFR